MHELLDLDIEEVSAVDLPANKRTFLVIKRAEISVPDDADPTLTEKAAQLPAMPRPLTTRERLQQQQMREQWFPLWDAFCTSVYDIVGMPYGLDEAEDCAILLRQSVDEFASLAREIFAKLGVMRKAEAPLEDIRKIGAVMAADRRQRLQEAIAALQVILDEALPPCDEPLTLTQKGQTMADKGVALVEGNVAQDQIDTLRKRAETAEARVQELEPLVAKAADLEQQLAQHAVALAKAQQTPEEREAEWHASLPESVRKRLESDQLKIIALEKANQDNAEQAARAQFIQKTAAFRNLGMTQDNWPILKAIDGMPEEPREQLLHLLTAATEQLRTSTLFKSVGFQEADPGAASNGSSAEAELMRLTKAYQAEHHCDQPTAQNAVMDQHPDVYHRYVNEKRRVTRVASE